MKHQFYVLVMLILFSLQGWAKFSLPTKPIKYKGVDITQAVKILSKSVKTLKKDYTVFHWDNSGQEGQNEQMVLAAKKMANVFWAWFGNPETGNGGMYGYGLYASVDPLHTQDYGSQPSWSLLQLTLPKGLRVLDEKELEKITYNNDLLKDLQTIFSQFDCPLSPGWLMTYGGSSLTSRCQGFVRRIFQETLKIDALLYSYSRENLKSCKDAPNYHGAFVITSSRWMNVDNISFFTQKSTYALETRIRIQTLFLQNPETFKLDLLTVPSLNDKDKSELKKYFLKHPQGSIEDTFMTCDMRECRLTVKMCEASQSCEVINLENTYPALLSFNPIITSVEVVERLPGVTYRNSYDGTRRLLWSDLEGVAKANDISKWVQDNLIWCDQSPPFEEDNIASSTTNEVHN